MDHGVVT